MPLIFTFVLKELASFAFGASDTQWCTLALVLAWGYGMTYVAKADDSPSFASPFQLQW